MSLVESEAIILRTMPLGEADKLVSLVARRGGRLRGVARGARRPRSRFGAALEPLTHVRVWFFEREQRELVRLSQCELLQAFWRSSQDYSHTVALNHVAELSERMLPEREPSDRSFRLLLMVLRALRTGHPIWLPLTYCETWMVRLGGLLPDLAHCYRCRRAFGQQSAYVGVGTAGALCQRCRRPGMRALSPASRTLSDDILHRPLARLEAANWDRERTGELRNYLLDVIEHQTESRLVTRELLNALE